MDDIKIWHAHNDDSYIFDNSNYNVELFDVNHNYELTNINHLNKYLNEYVSFYYVWKNNLHSNIIGFSHNKYKFNNIDSNRILNDEIQVYEIYKTPAYNIYEDMNYVGLGSYIANIIDYMKCNYNDRYDDFIKLLFEQDEEYKCKPIRNSFACKWDIFNELMIFINNFLETLLDHSIENLTEQQLHGAIIQLNELQWNHRDNFFRFMHVTNFKYDFFGYPRNMAFLIEYLTNIYFMIFHKNNYFTNENN